MGLAVERVGTSSVIYRIGLFQGASDEAAAEGRFVHVYVDSTTGTGERPVRPLPPEIRSALAALDAPPE
jgi:acyl-CoA thioester hydrolase